MNTAEVKGFTILTLLARPSGSKADSPSFQPHSIRRESDSEVFTIGDRVTNGTQMTGKITGFEFLEGYVYVNHTWSGVGMDLDSLSKVNELPSKHQIGDKVTLAINQAPNRVCSLIVYVINVHFFENKVKYDLEVPLQKGDTTRFYNIDSCYVL